MNNQACVFHMAWKVQRDYLGGDVHSSLKRSAISEFAQVARAEFEVYSKMFNVPTTCTIGDVARLDMVTLVEDHDKVSYFAFKNTTKGVLLYFELDHKKCMSLLVTRRDSYWEALSVRSERLEGGPILLPSTLAQSFYEDRHRLPSSDWTHIFADDVPSVKHHVSTLALVSMRRTCELFRVDLMYETDFEDLMLVHSFWFTSGGMETKCHMLPIKHSMLDAHHAKKDQKPEPQETKPTAPPMDESMCVICMDRPAAGGAVHGDTMHMCCCRECTDMLKAKKENACPMCRAPVDCFISKVF